MNAWWDWLENTVMTNVRVQPWYNNASSYGLRGYLNDRVNRIIGYAIVRQIREKPGNCKPAQVIRSSIPYCTGETGITNEDSNDYCTGWVQKTRYNENLQNCTNADEYVYR
jgi:polycystin 1L2